MERSKKILLYLMNDTGSIWNCEDWKAVRKHRIIGSFVGCLANVPRQVKEHGFPLLLSKNETKLLLDKGLAVLQYCPKFTEPPDSICQKTADNLRSESFAKQITVLKSERALEIEEKANLIFKGKLEKMRKRNAETVLSSDELKRKIIEGELMKIRDPSPSCLYVHTPAEDPWVQPDDFVNVTWSYPNTDMERIEYATFQYLWETGYTVTGGGKFGATLAAYEGDSLQCHAQLLILCVTRHKKISTRFLVSFARLAHSVKKTAVLAYFSAENDVAFQSVDWATD